MALNNSEVKPIFAVSCLTGNCKDIILIFNALVSPPQLLYMHRGIEDHEIDIVNISPNGRVLYYTACSISEIEYEKLSKNEQQKIEQKAYLCEYDENYNLLYKDEAPYVYMSSWWPPCLRYLRPFLGVHINECPCTINIVYKNLKTNRLKMLTEIEFKFTDIIREYKDNGIHLTPEDILKEELLGEKYDNLEDAFYDELTNPGSDHIFLEYMYDKINYYYHDLDEANELANKYQITNDGETVYIYIKFRGNLYKEVLVSAEEY